MAHFAKIGLNNKVLTVLKLNNSDMLNADGIEDETVGQQYLELHNNWPAQMWIQTSYNTALNRHLTGGTPFRGNYASIGFIWDENNEIFWPPKPYASWVKHLDSASWKSPIGDAPELSEEKTTQNISLTHNWRYVWDEDNQSWNLVNLML
jgi:hypothetical protein